MNRLCELCKRLARMHCQSDQASLCWDCDAKVHSANFLVARHSRNLLCQVCQSPTAWSASGAVLAPTVSVCQQCVEYGRRCDDEIGDEDEAGDEIEEAVPEEMEDNQVVPWSPPPPTEVSSSGEEDDVTASRDRRIQNASSNPPSNDDHGCSSSEPNINRQNPNYDSPANVTDLSRVGATGSGLLEPLRRFHGEETVPRAQLTVDLNFCDSS